MPTITVIVPVYKVESYLHRCVDSILGQTFTDFELILVDDGSPDGCPAICDEYAKKDSRVHVIHQQNGGLSAARNAGIDWAFAHSDSRWLTFIDSDDWVHEQYLEVLLHAAEACGTVVSMCRCVQTDGTELMPEYHGEQPVVMSAEDAYVTEPLVMTACWKLYRKEEFLQIRFPAGRFHEDEYVTYRVLFAHDKVAVVQVSMYGYYVNQQGIVNSPMTRKRASDVYDALEIQIAYFEAGGYLRACRMTVRRYIGSIVTRLQSAKESNISREVFRFLRGRRRKNFRRFAKLLDPKDDLDGWILNRAFPGRMWVYWHYLAATKKLKAFINKKHSG